ncbi:hypothetical protein E2C01_050407 [Portunus trituberculatus]|uniref:Uncharacterized protein n=1 Tax=Portunus trituberculatus TaxID=210409 RepID=A0A5B7GFV1_PORTR|nr:hypothetical protein [Portunus trituberculatus]
MEQCSANDSVFSDSLHVLPFSNYVEAWFLHLEAIWAELSRSILGAFWQSREACFTALDLAQYDSGCPSMLLVRLSALNRMSGVTACP